MTAYEQASATVGDPATFIERLNMRLVAHSVSHGMLARKLDVCPTQMSRWMTGRVRPNMRSMLRMDSAADEIIYG